jgi:hypothetical protein
MGGQHSAGTKDGPYSTYRNRTDLIQSHPIVPTKINNLQFWFHAWLQHNEDISLLILSPTEIYCPYIPPRNSSYA